MAHRLNKSKMKNDIILTIALVVSMFLVRLIMHFTNLNATEYDTPLFFILFFVCIKITYNLFLRWLNKYMITRKYL